MSGTAYDPFSPEAMADPYPLYRALRDEGPVHPLPRYDAYALPRFEEVWQVLADGESFSSAEGPVFARARLEAPFAPRSGEPDPASSFASWDPPAHTAMRQAVSPPLRPRPVAALDAEVRRIARARLDAALPTGRLDVVADYAGPVSLHVACRILGFDPDDSADLLAAIHRSARRDPGESGRSTDGAAATAELMRFVLDQVGRRRAAGGGPGAGVLDRLLAGPAALGDGAGTAVATQLMTLLIGGTETLPKILAGGLRQLAAAPADRAAVAADPALAGPAFEEMVRHQGVLQWVGRTAVRDVRIGGVDVRPGQRLFLLLQSANRDEREFPDAERFDVWRRPPRHVGFGLGQHHCVGSHVARLEGTVLLEELLACVPVYDVDEATAVRPPSEFQLGYTALAITFPPVDPSDRRAAEERP